MTVETDGAATPHPVEGKRDDGSPRIRVVVFMYNTVWLGILLALGVLHIQRPHMLESSLAGWPGYIATSTWFAMLGSVAISYKGVYDHYRLQEWSSGGWDLWYFGRPLSGAIVGIMTYWILKVLNSTEPPTSALAVAAFALGTQEKRFFAFLSEVANLVLTVPSDAQSGLLIKGVQPDHGSAGTPVLIVGQGMRPGCAVTLGGAELAQVVVNPDGTSAAGAVPAGIAPGSVDVAVTNPDGLARVLKRGFTVG